MAIAGPRTWSTLVVAIAVVAMAAVGAAAQTSDATLLGSVLDSQQLTVPGATVTITNVNTGRTRTTVTGPEGRFRVAALPPGLYRVEVQLSGFATAVREGLTLSVGQEATISMTLGLAGASESVTVTAEAPLVDTSSVQIGTVVTNAELSALPVPGRNFAALAALAPGVAAVGSGSISAGGQDDSLNMYLLDGINNKAPNLGGARGEVSLEGVQEFVVIANQFAAEYGQAAGAVISAVTRSGSNVTKGRVYTFYRNETFNWDNPFAVGSVIQPFSEVKSGFFLGGPIRRNKIHYFATYEMFRQRTTSLITSPLVPLAERTYPTPFTQHQPLIKVDAVLSDSQSMWFRYRVDKSFEGGNGIGGLNLPSQGSDRNLTNQDLTINHTWLVGPSVLSETRVNVGYRRLLLDPRPYSDQFTPQINRPSSVSGGASGGVQFTHAPSAFVTNNLSISKGDHSFKFGGEVQWYGGGLDSCPGGRGTFTFTTDAPFNPNVASTFPTRYTQTISPDFPRCRIPLPNLGFVAFAQDSWRVKQNLTLSLGLRYDTDNAWNKVVGQPIDDRANLAPRLGAVWDPTGDGKTAVRGGYGIYIDQGLLNTTLAVKRGLVNQNLDINRPGYPDPFSRVGTPRTTTKIVVGDNIKTAETRSTTLGVKREILSGVALSVDGVYTNGYNELYGIDINAPINGVRPNVAHSTITQINTGAQTFYRALLVGLRAERPGLRFGVSYTLAKATSNSEGRQSLPTDGVNLSKELGPQNNDRRHQIVANITWAAPLGVQVAAVFQARTGMPINITTGIDNNANGAITDRPDLAVAGGDPFSQATYFSGFTGRVGDLSRNSARGPDFATMDLRLSKMLNVRRYRVEVFGEAFNLLNRTNRNNPSGNLRNSNFGISTDIVGTMRQVEFGFRFDF